MLFRSQTYTTAGSHTFTVPAGVFPSHDRSPSECWGNGSRGMADDFNPNNNLTLLEIINQPNQKIQNIIKIFLDFADSICYNPGEVAFDS